MFSEWFSHFANHFLSILNMCRVCTALCHCIVWVEQCVVRLVCVMYILFYLYDASANQPTLLCSCACLFTFPQANFIINIPHKNTQCHGRVMNFIVSNLQTLSVRQSFQSPMYFSWCVHWNIRFFASLLLSSSAFIGLEFSISSFHFVGCLIETFDRQSSSKKRLK